MLIKRQTGREQQKVKKDFEMNKQCYYPIKYVCSGSAFSPLFALIALKHDKISRFCLQKLLQNITDLKNSYLLAAACCNGNALLIKGFTNDQTSELKEEKWNDMFPNHVIGVLTKQCNV